MRDRGKNVVAIIPVYDELGKIGKVLSKFSSDFVDEIFVVVDCPSKHILSEIKESCENLNVPFQITINPKRRGIGYGIKMGIQYALDGGFDVIVIIAGNNKDNPEEIPRFLHAIYLEGFDYVQGSCFLPGGRNEKTPIIRNLFIQLFPFIWSLLTGVRCTDVTNGFRAYKTKIFLDKQINIWQSWLNSYQLEYYIHYKILTLGYKTKEVSVSKIYPYKHKGGYSKISPFRDWWKIISPLIYLKIGAKK